MIDDIIDGIIERERAPKGRPEFTDHPADAGGATKYGVTRETLSAYLGRPATVDEVRNLTIEQARSVYRHMFIVRPGFARLIEPLRSQMIDFGVHSGPETAIKALQRIVGVNADGIIGPKTSAAVEQSSAFTLACRVWEARLQYMAQITESDVRRKCPKARTNAENIEGWVNRMLKINPWRQKQ